LFEIIHSVQDDRKMGFNPKLRPLRKSHVG
jgi:hypothetical protein